MKIGISTASLFPRYDTEGALKVIKSLGVEVAEVFLSTFYEYRPEFAKALAAEINGLQVNSVHANSLNFEPNLFNPTRRVKGDGFYWLDQIARSAQLLDCKNYTFHGLQRPAGDSTDIESLCGCLGEAVGFMAGYGINLCLENVSRCLYDRPGLFSKFKERIPALSGVLDLKQARRSHYPLAAYINDMAGAISYVHLSDVDENGKTCLPGRGIYDFADIIKRLKGVGFDGNLIIEVYSGDYGEASELQQSCEYLREIIYALN